jgi:hypothetical protein
MVRATEACNCAGNKVLTISNLNPPPLPFPLPSSLSTLALVVFQDTHDIAPEKMILATEACNCAGNVVMQSPNIAAWWRRAERLAIDILEVSKQSRFGI